MIIYNNFVIITPNKAGNHSTEKLFMNMSIDNKIDYIRFSENNINHKNDNPIHMKLAHSVLIPKEIQHLKRILMVRNPYERFASIVFLLNKSEKKDNFKQVLLETRKNIKRFLKDFSEKHETILDNENENDTVEINPEGIIADFYSDKPSLDVKFFLTWYRTLGEYADISKPDYIVKIENAVEDFKKIGIIIDNFPHEFKTNNKNNFSLLDIFKTQDNLDFANEYFNCANDAIRFGYKPIYKIEDL
jgi:hypothetical protein